MALDLEDADKMLLAKELVSSVSAIGGKTAALGLVAVKDLMTTPCVDIVGDGHRKARQAVYAHLVESQAEGGADRVVVCKVNVWEMRISVVLSFVYDHGEHLRHRVVDTFDITVAVGAADARGWQLRAWGRTGVRYPTNCCKAAPKRDVRVDQNIGGAFRDNFHFRHGVHVCSPAEAVRQEENVRVTLWRGKKRPEPV